MFVLDCDPGIDDAAAILLMLAAPELAPAAVTVVAGNVESDLGAWNARGVVDIAGRPAPVFAGCPRRRSSRATPSISSSPRSTRRRRIR